MPISTTTRAAILDLTFNATTWANYAINATTSPETNIAFGLNTADPGIGGTMSTSEAAYTSYARVNVARTSGGLVRTGNSVSPASNITFPTATGGSETETYFTSGKTGGGATAILWYGTITPNISVTSSTQPILTTASTITLT